jgi:short subunit dehydrogenase-like uncharacterized protein
MSNPQVVIYGASGYTGKLIAWHLAEYGIPFIAAGRNQARIEEQMALVPELKNADYSCEEVAHDEEALARLFQGKKVVYNVVGPFMQLSEPVVQASLEASCHYLDTTGETDWMMFLREKFGEAYRNKDLVLAPASAWMWQAGLMAAEIALENDDIDTLDIAYLADSNTSVASTMSFMRMLTRPQYFLEQNQMVEWPTATSYKVNLPGVIKSLDALPWGGGGEPIWYQHDSRVSSCSVLVAFRNQAMFDALKGLLLQFEEEHADKSEEEREAITNAMGNAMVSEEPEREIPSANRSMITCHARGNVNSRTVILRGNCPYLQTGVIAAESAERILKGKHRQTGFTSACAAIGTRRLIEANAERGYLSYKGKKT